MEAFSKTRDSQVVTHPSVNRGRRNLTGERVTELAYLVVTVDPICDAVVVQS